jgi:hypothetical protein
MPSILVLMVIQLIQEEYILCMSRKRLAYFDLLEVSKNSAKDIFQDFSTELQAYFLYIKFCFPIII